MAEGCSLGYRIVALVTLLATNSLVLCGKPGRTWHLQNVSDLLDNILKPEKGYQKAIRPPSPGGIPTEVFVDLYVKSMGPIAEEDMAYSMDCYFRQTWFDRRLRFEPLDDEMKSLKMDFKLLSHMWAPDTFFLNGRKSYLHTVTYPNRLLRLYTDGKIMYSQRLTIMATCPMDLRKYPMDNQTCPLLIGSYAYGHREVKYTWKKGPIKSLSTTNDLRMAQFELVGWQGYDTLVPRPSIGNASVVVMNFHLTRSIGYCVLQTYMPLYMIVVISWVSFWINREATPARVTLGITTILTTSTIKGVAVSGLPQLSYNTAMDYFLHISFFYVFASLVEFAGVNFFTKTAMPSKPPEEEPEDQQDQSTVDSPLMPDQKNSNNKVRFFNGRANFLRIGGKENCCTSFMHCLRGSSKYRSFKSRTRYADGVNSVSKIDIVSRYVFPLSFLIINTLYWVMYLHGGP